MDEKMILEPFKIWMQKKLGGYWSKPFVGCIRCMASAWGAATFWPVVLIVFQFHVWEVPLFIADIGMLVCLNWFIYKKV